MFDRTYTQLSIRLVKMKLAGFMGLILCLLLAGKISSQQQVIIEASQDNTVYELFNSRSNGSGLEVQVGVTNSDINPLKRRGFFQFPIADNMPEGATITDAKIELYCDKVSSSGVPSDYAFHRVLQAWGEGNSVSTGGQGVQAQTDDATWQFRFYPNITWNTPGGDFASIQSAIASVNNANQVFMWSGDQLINDVQDMLDNPESNFGWVLKATDESTFGTGRAFRSRENFPEEFPVPKLIVQYDMISSINKQDQEIEYAVFPNPGQNRLNIQTTEMVEGAELQIIDIQGRVVHTEIMQGNLLQYDASSLLPGYYFIQFLGTNSRTLRWIKK